MSWLTDILDDLRDTMLEAHRKRRYPQDSYEEDPEEELPPRPPDFKGDIPLHFNARPGEDEE